MASRISAGGLFESAPIRSETVTLVSTIQGCSVIGSLPNLRDYAAGADPFYCSSRKRLVSRTAKSIASSVLNPDLARTLATISLAVSQRRTPLSSGLSSMMEHIERFCRDTASFSARCRSRRTRCHFPSLHRSHAHYMTVAPYHNRTPPAPPSWESPSLTDPPRPVR